MPAKMAVGIDLGTTFSCVAVFHKGRPEIIKVGGQRTIPSVVFFDEQQPYVSVGFDAQDDAPRCYKNEIFDVKRIIGRQFADFYVQDLINSGHYPFSIVKNDDEKSGIQIRYQGQQIVKSPEEVSSKLLISLKNAASEYLGGDVSEAVISVPAYFSNSQRKATKKAAELAGLKVRFISEPVAAAVHYAYENIKSSTLLVIDFGGGTLDVSIIKVDGRKFEVKAVNGDTALGGRDIDGVLIKHFESKLNCVLDPKFYRRFKTNCIKLKKKLSLRRDSYEEIQQTFFYNDEDYTLTMSRNMFDKLNKSIFDKAMDVVEMCLFKADLNKSDLDEIVLVGGSCKNLKLQEMLQNYFQGKKLRKDVDPDEAIALGACIQAAALVAGTGELENYKISDVTPLSLGVQCRGQMMDVFIPRNTPLPVSETKYLYTSNNDQCDCAFKIFEGERAQVQYNNKLGEFTIQGLPKAKASDIRLEITFNLNEDGILQITASETTTGISKGLSVSVGQFHLCEYQINKSLKDALENKKDDQIFIKFINEMNQKISRCNSVAYDARNISVVEDRHFLETRCENFVKLATSIDFHKINSLRNEYGKFCKEILPIIQMYPNIISRPDYFHYIIHSNSKIII